MASIIVALDFADRLEALQLVDQLDPARCRLKVGKEMFTRFGPGFVQALQGRGFEVFLDLKFHDIPNTAAAAVASAAELGVWMVNVHASGGRRMMEACVRELENFGEDRPLLIGVTVLTSLTDPEIQEIGWEGGAGATWTVSPRWPGSRAWMGWCARRPRRRRCVSPWVPGSGW